MRTSQFYWCMAGLCAVSAFGGEVGSYSAKKEMENLEQRVVVQEYRMVEADLRKVTPLISDATNYKPLQDNFLIQEAKLRRRKDALLQISEVQEYLECPTNITRGHCTALSVVPIGVVMLGMAVYKRKEESQSSGPAQKPT